MSRCKRSRSKNNAGRRPGLSRLLLAGLSLGLVAAGDVQPPKPGVELPAGSQTAVEVVRPVKAELVADVAAIVPGEPFWAGLRLTMDRGWHTYWINPGDAGMATKVAWTLPEGFQAGPLQWPYPKRMEVAEMVSSKLVSFGYEDEVLLVAKITPPAKLSKKSVTLEGKADWVQCKEVCIKGGEKLSLTLPVAREAGKVEETLNKQFQAAKDSVPISAPEWTITASAKDDAILLRLTPFPSFRGTITELMFFPEEQGVIEHAAPQVLKREGEAYVLQLPRSAFSQEPKAKLRGVLVSNEGWLGIGSSHALQLDVPLEMTISWRTS